ncbi:MAG: phospholipase D-like domain-containing protein [candidate division WOR-3 bacterium]|nr:phospholipase D-like domain-containing protein [candidate division WOR-3 bacterium]
MKKILMIIIAALPLLIFAFEEAGLEFYNAEGVYPINNRDYAPTIIRMFDNAEKTIHIMILSAGYYPNYPKGVNRQIYQSLFDAAERGVEVIVVLDQSGYNPSQSLSNMELGEFLRSGGVDVYYDDPDVTVHSKTLMVDSLYTSVGSTNWSYWALDKNNESSVLIKSEEIGRIYEEYFADVFNRSHPKITVIN